VRNQQLSHNLTLAIEEIKQAAGFR
jgi:hypothetical protein